MSLQDITNCLNLDGLVGEEELRAGGFKERVSIIEGDRFRGIVIILMFSNTIALCQFPLGLQLGLTLSVRVRNSAFYIYLKQKLCK